MLITMKKMIIFSALLVLAACSADDGADDSVGEPPPAPEPTMMLLMVEDITQASDIVWGIEDPQTDEEWQVIDDAAVALIDAFKMIEAGTAGPNDKAWAAEEKFRAYVQQEYEALEMVRAAVAARDVDGVLDAGGYLYTPCEECHIDYNPAVINQEL